MLQAQYWERQLLDRANAALESGISTQNIMFIDDLTLQEAYARCKEITRENSKTFYMASSLLPEEKRRAVHALYAFCRISDDLIDRPQLDQDRTGQFSRGILESWRQMVLFGRSLSDGIDAASRAVSLAWTDVRHKYCIPRGYVEQLIDGLMLDLNQVRYDTFAHLAEYCYGVACTVGLMSMHITGYHQRAAIPYAIRLGVALQLTNILRDVGEDWRAGRLYLPLEELADFGLNVEDIAAGRVDDRWRSFMRFQISRTRMLYAESLPGVALLHQDGRFAIAAAGELYSAILDQIEANDYDVFNQRASTGAWGKIRRLPGIWWRANTINVNL
jgi:15-cis-phytoene synthase